MEYTENIEFKEEDLLAIAYLKDVLEYKKYLNNYKNIKIYKISEYETYLILPKYKNMKINIYELEEDNKKGNMINSANEPFVINCNNEENSNVILEVMYKDITLEYELSLKDDKLNKNKYITDITKYNVE